MPVDAFCTLVQQRQRGRVFDASVNEELVASDSTSASLDHRPKARRGSRGEGTGHQLIEWLKENGRNYSGKWVALNRMGELIDSDESRTELQRRLREKNQLSGASIAKVY